MERQRKYQRTPRYTKRLEATFSSGVLTYRGILSDISDNGLFIRTSRGFTPGTAIDITIIMPDNQTSHLTGIVRRSIKTPLSTTKNGMGVELTQKDAVYINFYKSYREEVHREFFEEKKPNGETTSPPEFQIITCPGCGAKNKVLYEKLLLNPLCGKCRTLLTSP
jgi:Tfp pilus assembly protein PilZ